VPKLDTVKHVCPRSVMSDLPLTLPTAAAYTSRALDQCKLHALPQQQVTCFLEEDLPYIHDCLATPLEPLAKAHVFPALAHIAAFANTLHSEDEPQEQQSLEQSPEQQQHQQQHHLSSSTTATATTASSSLGSSAADGKRCCSTFL
jgi:hypothetical protein